MNYSFVKKTGPNKFVYKLSEKVTYNGFSLEYIWVSYSNNGETGLFPCDENGKVTSWTELPGSGVDLDNHEAMSRLVCELGNS